MSSAFTPSGSLADEITSINSIYPPESPLDDETLSQTATGSPIYSLRLPLLSSVVLRIEFPVDYADAPPSILGTQSVGDDVAKGGGNKIVDIARDVLAQVYVPGQSCIFDLLEELREAVEKAQEQGLLQLHDHEQSTEPASDGLADADPQSASYARKTTVDLGPEPPWIIGTQITEKKSVFLARIAPVTSTAQAKSYVQHLLSTDKKAARATHNITAWRIRGPNETSFQDCDDDGETAAGGRLLHLMQLMDVWNVAVVVTRWYGGILLGPDRFRIINTAAREALVLGGYGKNTSADGKKKGKR